jgi:hypothetical protein
MNVFNIAPTGAVVYWNAGPTRRELLEERFRQLGLEKHVPPARTDANALRAALKDHCDRRANRRRGKDKLVQPHKRQSKHGFEVVHVDRGEVANDYSMDFSAKVDEGRVVVTRGYADTDELQEAFAVHKATLTGASVGQALVAVLAQLGGTALRPSGGVYWIAEEAVETWQSVAAAVQSAASGENGNNVYMLRTLLDEEGIRAVKDAIVSEITDASDKLAEQIASNDLGEQALTKRQIVAASLHARVTQYEAILGEALDTLHQVIRLAEEAAASAIAVKEADEIYAGVF